MTVIEYQEGNTQAQIAQYLGERQQNISKTLKDARWEYLKKAIQSIEDTMA